ncbi:MAG: YIP1 family protein [Terrimicrobiaceae bacterium]
MATIFINRNRQSIGQFTEQEVADGLHAGTFFPDDLAWKESMESWKPLSTFTDLPPPSITAVAQSAPPLVPQPSETVEPAWERAAYPFSFSAAFETIKDVLTRPTEVFRAMACEGGFAKPLRFYILVGWITGAAALLYQAAASLINPEMFVGAEAKNLSQGTLIGVFVGFAVILPIFLAIGSFVSAGSVHLAMMIVGGAKKPFETTYRAMSYASASVSVLQLLPICGGYLYMIVSLFYSVIALKEAHRTELWRPIAAMILMLVFCCGIAFGIGALAVGLAAAATK